VFVVPGYGGDASSVERLVTLLGEFGLDVRVVVRPTAAARRSRTARPRWTARYGRPARRGLT
jgi:hypothetical protein